MKTSMTLFILSCKQSTDLLILMPFHTFLSLFWLNSTIEDTFALMNKIISLNFLSNATKHRRHFFFKFQKHSFMKIEIISLKWREKDIIWRVIPHAWDFFQHLCISLEFGKCPTYRFDFFSGIDVTTMSFLHLLI